MRLHIGASKVHRWLALLIGAQAIVWFTSGLIMSLLPIDVVHGDHRIDRNAEPALSVPVDLAGRLSGSAWLGLTAATGAKRARHEVLRFEVTRDP